jgi:hypothetical protein
MNMGRAGAIIRALRGGSKHSWHIFHPARSFVGVADTELQELATLAIDTIDKELGIA